MAQSTLETTIKENLIKNVIVIVCCVFFYPNIKFGLENIPSEAVSDFLLVISILIVTVSFANFAFTYEKTKIDSIGSRLLAHSATFLYLLLTALLLEAMVITIGIAYPTIYSFAVIFSVLLYVSLVLYDVWDLFRVR